jgi:hypothetical protein
MPARSDDLMSDQMQHSEAIFPKTGLATETGRLVSALRTMPNARAPGKRRS